MRIQNIQFLVCFLIAMSLSLVDAQDNIPATPPVITAQNIAMLRSVDRWDFADGFYEIQYDLPDQIVDDRGSPSFHQSEFVSGWFEMNKDGSLFAIVNREQDVWVINRKRQWVFEIQAPVNSDKISVPLIDAVFDPDAGLMLMASYSDGEQLFVLPEDGLPYGMAFLKTQVHSNITPVSLWIDCPYDHYVQCVAWLEIVSDSSESVVRLSSQDELRSTELGLAIADDFSVLIQDVELLHRQSYAPANDPEALVRIGRIEPPYTVTSSPEGLVKLWNLQSEEPIAEAQVENGPAVFGQINATASHFAWRDPYSDKLHLLNFETGEDQFVADLGGAYMQFLLVSPAADLIFAVHVDDEPVVIAWDVATGQRYNLGEFRQCSREPDMARLSADGTTLVIGCDTGLDIWQIASEG